MSDWQLKIEHALSAADSPTVVSRDLLTRFAHTANANKPVPVSTLTYWQESKVREAKLALVQRGLYLNCFRNKIGTLADAVPWLQRDAVISLNTVLGDSGVLNNPTTIITAVVPIDKGQPPPPRLGRRKTRAGVIHFFGMPRHIVQAGRAEDRLESASLFDHVRATPEKALIDWLYLGLSSRSKRTMPPWADIDVDLLDKRKLRRLASSAHLRSELEGWLKSD